ncbi:unnamed protein product [Lampetra fluviatilis]
MTIRNPLFEFSAKGIWWQARSGHRDAAPSCKPEPALRTPINLPRSPTSRRRTLYCTASLRGIVKEQLGAILPLRANRLPQPLPPPQNAHAAFGWQQHNVARRCPPLRRCGGGGDTWRQPTLTPRGVVNERLRPPRTRLCRRPLSPRAFARAGGAVTAVDVDAAAAQHQCRMKLVRGL